MPVFLVNGRRISGFQEIQGVPTEAIERVEILPEEVALQYGYRADQRVVNFVLKANFRSVSGELTGRGPTQGGRTTAEIEGNILRIAGATRWSMDAEYERSNPLYESERDIVRDPNNTSPAGSNVPSAEAYNASPTRRSRGVLSPVFRTAINPRCSIPYANTGTSVPAAGATIAAVKSAAAYTRPSKPCIPSRSPWVFPTKAFLKPHTNRDAKDINQPP
mgnify:CR=1 FL=1